MASERDRGFGQAGRGEALLLPGGITEKEFGKVYVKHDGPNVHVEFTVWVEDASERWKTGIALDASSSMENWFGRALVSVQTIPDNLLKRYKTKGWLRSETRDGQPVNLYTQEAFDDAIKQGYMKWSDNIVEPVARDFTAYLAGEFDMGGGTTVVYWACGEDGAQYEVFGDFTEVQCKTLEFNGPTSHAFGNATRLLPVLEYFIDRFRDATRTMLIFITDGRLDDLDAVKVFTARLAKDIEAGARTPVKCVLIGVGDQVDEVQMEALDDLDSGTDVDIWDHKIATEIRALSEIVVELVDENKIVAPTATVFDASGDVVQRFADGLPAKASFTMAASSGFFELEVGGKRIRQSIAVP